MPIEKPTGQRFYWCFPFQRVMNDHVRRENTYNERAKCQHEESSEYATLSVPRVTKEFF
jgi:hypothetical protein